MDVERRPSYIGYDYRARFLHALTQPPIAGVFVENGRWTKIFLQGVAQVDTACRENSICRHGIDHLLNVCNDSLILLDALPQDLRHDTTDSEVLFLGLVHDFGYGFKGVQWEDYHATNHPEYGTRVMRRFERMVLPKVVGANHSSLRFLHRNHALHDLAVSGTLEDMIPIATTESILPLLIKTSDKLDYFRKPRLYGIPRPIHYEDNPFFFLCDAVPYYRIMVDGKAIHYRVCLNGDSFDFKTWKQEVEKNYPSVFAAGEAYATVVGKKFVVDEIHD